MCICDVLRSPIKADKSEEHLMHPEDGFLMVEYDIQAEFERLLTRSQIYDMPLIQNIAKGLQEGLNVK